MSGERCAYALYTENRPDMGPSVVVRLNLRMAQLVADALEIINPEEEINERDARELAGDIRKAMGG